MLLRIARHDFASEFLLHLLEGLLTQRLFLISAHDIEASSTGYGYGFEVVYVDHCDAAGEAGDLVVECGLSGPASEEVGGHLELGLIEHGAGIFALLLLLTFLPGVLPIRALAATGFGTRLRGEGKCISLRVSVDVMPLYSSCWT